jgi:quercetin dioxygenase-like cupin family protein
MKVTRIFTGSDQQSHFEEIELSFIDSEYGKITNPIHTENIIFGEREEIDEISWHNPPCPQYVIMLKGSVEIQTGNGAKRIFKEGDIVLAEDVTGQGHITRPASEGVRRYLVIPLKE